MSDAAGEDVIEASRALLSRVGRGELRREALELLSAVGNPAARRALGQLELVLTPVSAPHPLDDPPPGLPEGWLEWASGFVVFPRRVAVATALAIALEARAMLENESPNTRTELVGLHTGPGGAILLDDALAMRVLPLRSAADRVLVAVARWLDEPIDANASAADDAWPALLRTRGKVELLSELAGVSWMALWTFRWLVGALCGPEHDVAASVGHAATYAHAALADRSRVSRAAHDALRIELMPC